MDIIPPPPATRALERSVIERLSDLDSGFYYWTPVVSMRHSAWLGVSLASVSVSQRSWVFDVVDCFAVDSIPLAIGVEPDVISACIYDLERPDIRGRILLDFNGGPRDLFIPKSILPPKPWDLDLSLTWSSDAVTEMLKVWTEVNAKRDDIYLLPQTPAVSVPTYKISQEINVSGDYFDYLLHADPLDASVIIGTLTSLAEFLQEQLGN